MKNEEKTMKAAMETESEPLTETSEMQTAAQTAPETETLQTAPEQETTAPAEQDAGTKRRTRKARLPKKPRSEKAESKKSGRLAAAVKKLPERISASSPRMKRALIASAALLLTANVVTTSVFVAYSVRSRREAEDYFYSNYWDIDDLRTEMSQDKESLREEMAIMADDCLSDMEQWKTGESIYSGSLGDDMSWSVDPETAILHIYGEGDMSETFGEDRRPAFGMLYADFIKKIVFDDDVTSVAAYAFQDFTKLEEVILGTNTETICEYAFSGCENLYKVKTYSALKKIEKNAFYGCSDLKSLSLPADFESFETPNCKSTCIRFTVEEGGDFNSDTSGCLYTDHGKTLLSCPIGTGYTYDSEPKSWDIPKSVTALADECFIGCHLKRLFISGTMKTVNLAAFRSTTVQRLKLRDGVEELINSPREDTCLQTVVLPDSVTTVDERLFNANICEMEFSDEQPALWMDKNGLVYTHNKKALLFVPYKDGESVTLRIADGTQRIRRSATEDMYNVSEIILPESLRVIEDDNFTNVCLKTGTTLKLPSNLEKIGENCFRYSRISKIVIPASVKEIGYNFLYSTNGGYYDEASDQYIEKDTKVVYNGTKAQWDSLFDDEAPDHLEMSFQ